MPSFFIADHRGVFKVDENNIEWKAEIRKQRNKLGNNNQRKSALKNAEKKKALEKTAGKKTEKKKVKKKIKNKSIKKTETEIEPESAEVQKLLQIVQVESIKGALASSKIKQEKAKQEEIKTLALKKDLAPFYLMKHFFSFSEKILQKIYQKPHDIEPQIESLFLAREPKKATQLIIRELESIIVDVQKELIEEMKAEGYKIKKGKK